VPARDANSFGQGIVLSANKTARLSPRVFDPSSTVNPALNAFGLFARAGAALGRLVPSARLRLHLKRADVAQNTTRDRARSHCALRGVS
jgi:hypothetical protein